MAYTFYQSVSNLEGISNDDQQFYLKLMKKIKRNEQLAEGMILENILYFFIIVHRKMLVFIIRGILIIFAIFY